MATIMIAMYDSLRPPDLADIIPVVITPAIGVTAIKPIPIITNVFEIENLARCIITAIESTETAVYSKIFSDRAVSLLILLILFANQKPLNIILYAVNSKMPAKSNRNARTLILYENDAPRRLPKNIPRMMTAAL